MSLPDALEAAARELPALEDAIRPANGDPERLRDALSAADAARVLAWLLAARPAEGEELAAAWAELPDGAGPLAAVEEEALPKAGRKALRRVRHRLRSRGVAAPEAPRQPRVATLPELDDRVGGARATALDPSGARIVYLVAPHPQGGARLFEVVLDDARGLLGFDVYSAGRKKARQFLRELAGRSRFPAVEVEEEEARALVAQAAAAHPADRPLPRGFGEWRSQLAPEDEKAPRPGDRVREALDAEAAETSAEEAETLVRAGRVGPWPPTEDRLRAVFDRLREALDSQVVVSPAAKGEQIAGLLEDAAEELYDEAGARVAAHRLRESAYVFWRTGDEAAARACLAGARAFESGDPRANPVARAMLETALGPALRALEQERGADAGETGGEAVTSDEAGDDAPRIVKP